MSINRTYQGKITGAHWVTGKKNDRTEDSEISESEWKTLITTHLSIFHSAINYYLVCFAACAKGSEIESLKNIFDRVHDSWKTHLYRRSGEGPGFRDSLVQHLPHLVTPKMTFDEACDSVIDRINGSDEILQLALESLLTDLGGESSIQQGGRSYLPYFCNPNSKANFPRNKLILERKKAKTEIPQLLYGKDRLDFNTFRDRFELPHFTNLDNAHKEAKGDKVKEKLKGFLKHLLEEKIISEKQSGEWLKEIESLDPATLSLPAYNGAAAKGAEKNRLYSFLLFKFLPACKERFDVFRSTFSQPKEETKEKKLSDKQRGILALETRLQSKGDDPIFLARNERGFVFKSFSRQLAATDGDFSPTWIEFDISAFRQALLTLNQIEQKTTERLETLEEIEAQVEYFESKKGKAFDPDEPITFHNDPRFKLWEPLRAQLIEQANNEFGTYGLGKGTIKGWTNLLPRMQKFLKGKPDASKEEIIKSVIVPFQQKHKNIGSVLLFRTLADPKFHAFWQEIKDSQTQLWQKNQWSHDILSDLILYEQLKEQRDDLMANLHIRLTPAHIKRSRRPIMLSDLKGASKVVHLKRDDESSSLITSIYAKAGSSNTFEQQRIEFCYSSPRLLRDNLTGTENRNLLQPLMKGLGLRQPEAKNIAKTSKDLAVALMPDWLSSSNSVTPDRFLLNFPAKLETDWIAKALGKAERWDKQFNGANRELLHLHWPETIKNTVKRVWWENPDIIENGFTLTGIDLGLKIAASFTTIHVVSSLDKISKAKQKYAISVGSAGGFEWFSIIKAHGALRLPGENAKVLRPSSPGEKECSFLPEIGGSKGRLADEKETKQYKTYISDLSFCAADWLQEKAINHIPTHLPEQNDDLLILARNLQSHISERHHVLHLSKQEGLRERRHEDLNERQKKRLEEAIKLQTNKDEQDALFIRIEKNQKMLKSLIILLANRILPQRRFDWDIVKGASTKISDMDGNLTDFTPFVLKRIERQMAQPRKIMAQRGLSVPRIEQLENLRRRMASLQRELNRTPGQPMTIGFGRQSGSVPEPAQEILDKLDHLKEQRVKQTAHLILTQALGLRLKRSKTPKGERLDYVHGEYERTPNLPTSDFIVIEDLMRYRTRSDRSRSENRKLMQWSHRAIAETLKELAEPYGIPVLTTAASYSSRFCAATGRAGFRAVEINRNRLDHPAFKRLLNSDQGSAEERIAAKIRMELTRNKDKQHLRFLIPMEGGPLFVPVITKKESRKNFPVSQADINASHNIGLRAIAAPGKLELLHKVRAVTSKEVTSPRTDNIREKAAFDKANLILSAKSNTEFTKEIRSKKYSNFFTIGSDPKALEVEFDSATTTTKDGKKLSMASSYGLWTTVKNLTLPNIVTLFKETLEKHKLSGSDEIPM